MEYGSNPVCNLSTYGGDPGTGSMTFDALGGKKEKEAEVVLSCSFALLMLGVRRNY